LLIGGNSAGNYFEGEMTRFKVMNSVMNNTLRNAETGNYTFQNFRQGSGTEGLSNGDDPSAGGWGATGDFDVTGTDFPIAWTADQTSTLTQSSGTHTVGTVQTYSAYRLTYDSTLTQVTGTLDVDMGNMAIFNYSRANYGADKSLIYTTGKHMVVFLGSSNILTNDISISATSSGGQAGDSVTFDNFSIKRCGYVVDFNAADLVG
jgi:hypothetical protein